MPYSVIGAGLKSVNGVYYRTQHTPPIFRMQRDDGSGKIYVLYLDNKYDKWYIARADKAAYIRVYYALNPRINKIKDTFFDKEYHLPDELRKEVYRMRHRRFDARGRHPPSLGGWRPFIQTNELLNKIEKGIFPPPNVVDVVDTKYITLLRKNNIFWFSSMLRIRNIENSLKFYIKYFKLKVIYSEDRTANDDDINDDCTVMYLVTPKPGYKYIENFTSKEAKNDLLNYKHGVLELVFYHNRDKAIKYTNGNRRNSRGFGHIGFNTNSMEEMYEKLKNEIDFIKKPGIGKIERQCFALDPDGYWIELVSRNPKNKKLFRKKWVKYIENFPVCNLSQTMLRIKNGETSLKFYVDILNMKLIREIHFPQWKFSLYSLITEDYNVHNPHCQSDYDAMHYTLTRFNPILELCQSHPGDNKDGLIDDENFKYCNGNETDKKGFGNLGFLVDNIDEVLYGLTNLKHVDTKIILAPKNSNRKYNGIKRCKNDDIAFVTDPDGYYIKLIQRAPNYRNDEQKTDEKTE